MIRCENCGIELDEEEAVEGREGEFLCADCAEEEDMFDYLLIADLDEDE